MRSGPRHGYAPESRWTRALEFCRTFDLLAWRRPGRVCVEGEAQGIEGEAQE